MVERFAAELRVHLTPAFLRTFAGSGFAVEMVVTSDLLSETLLIYRLAPR